VHNLGALSLDSQPLKYSLRAEAANWKVAFSKTIHKRASEDLLVGGWAAVGAAGGVQGSCWQQVAAGGSVRVEQELAGCSGRVERELGTPHVTDRQGCC